MSAVPFERAELIAIRERAQDLAANGGFVPGWQRAHLVIADAVDHLDAMMARCSGRLPNDPDQPPAAETPGQPAEPNRRSVASDGSAVTECSSPEDLAARATLPDLVGEQKIDAPCTVKWRVVGAQEFTIVFG